MARTLLTVTDLVANASVAEPAGNAVDVANGHYVPGSVPLEELVIDVNQTFAGAKNITIKAGANPPALAAGQGDLVIAINAATRRIGPFTSARFSQADGSLWIDLEAGTTGTIKAIHMPRTA
jgi:hypothetical protein